MWSPSRNTEPNTSVVKNKRVSFKKDIEETFFIKSQINDYETRLLISKIQKIFLLKKIKPFYKIIASSNSFHSKKSAIQYFSYICKTKIASYKFLFFNKFKLAKSKFQNGLKLLKILNRLQNRKKTYYKHQLLLKIQQNIFREEAANIMRARSKSSGSKKAGLLVTKQMVDKMIYLHFQRNKQKLNCESIEKLVLQSQQLKIFQYSPNLIQSLQKLVKSDKFIYSQIQQFSIKEITNQQIKKIQKDKFMNKIPKNKYIPNQIVLKALQIIIKQVSQLNDKYSYLQIEQESKNKNIINKNKKQIKDKQYKKIKQLIDINLESKNYFQARIQISNLIRKFQQQQQFKNQTKTFQTISNLLTQNQKLSKLFIDTKKIISKLPQIDFNIDNLLLVANNIKINKKECTTLINRNIKTQSDSQQDHTLVFVKSLDNFYQKLSTFIQNFNKLYDRKKKLDLQNFKTPQKNVNPLLKSTSGQIIPTFLPSQNQKNNYEFISIKKELNQKIKTIDTLNCNLYFLKKQKQSIEIVLQKLQQQKDQKILKNQQQLKNFKKIAQQMKIFNQNKQQQLKSKNRIISQFQKQKIKNCSLLNQYQNKINQYQNRLNQLISRNNILNSMNSQLKTNNEKLKQKNQNVQSASQATFQAYQKQLRKNQQLQKINKSLLQTNQNINELLQQNYKKINFLQQKLKSQILQKKQVLQNNQFFNQNILGQLQLPDSNKIQPKQPNQIIETSNDIYLKQKNQQLQQKYVQISKLLKQQKENAIRIQSKLNYYIQLNIQLQSAAQNLNKQHSKVQLTLSKQLHLQISKLQSQNNTLKQQIQFIKKQHSKDQFIELRNKLKVAQLQINKWNQVFVSKNIQIQKKQSEYDIIIQSFEKLKKQFQQLKQWHINIVNQQIMKAIKIQEAQFNQFIKKHDKQRNKFYQNIVIPQRKKEWEKQINNWVKKNLVEQEKKKYQLQLIDKFKNIRANQLSLNPQQRKE